MEKTMTLEKYKSMKKAKNTISKALEGRREI